MGMLNYGGYGRVVKTVGNGPVGPKSFYLRADESAIEGLDKTDKRLFFPPHISVTPNFLVRFLADSGALTARSFEEANERIIKGKFLPVEIEEITVALLELHPLDRFDNHVASSFMVRSDDYAEGVGLLHSGAASIVSKDVNAMVEQILHQIKLILASNFSPDAVAFNGLKGITENPGALIMPVFGKGFFDDHHYPAYHINYLLIPGVGSLASLGCGVGGANSIRARTCSSADEALLSFSRFNRFFQWKAVRHFDGTIEEIDLSSTISASMDFINEDRSDFIPDPAVGELVSKVGARYLELVNDDEDAIRPYWMVVQSAPITYQPITRPKLDRQVIVFDALGAIGTKIVTSGKLHYSPNLEPNADDLAFNKNNSGYVLVVDFGDLGSARNFRKWGLQYFSNAAAVVLNLHGGILKDFSSHLGGFIRASGIPVIGCNFGLCDAQLLESLKQEPTQDRACTVYANEFAKQPGPRRYGSNIAAQTSEGFLAIEK